LGLQSVFLPLLFVDYLASIYSLREADSKADVKQMMKKTRDMMLAVLFLGDWFL
jgi:hypothetical protein